MKLRELHIWGHGDKGDLSGKMKFDQHTGAFSLPLRSLLIISGAGLVLKAHLIKILRYVFVA